MTSTLVPARKGVAVRVRRGQCLKVINTYGEQVVDTWAFSAADPRELMSMEHSRGINLHMCPRVGDALYSNRRRPMLNLIEDTTPGIHDTMLAACDTFRYTMLGHVGYHDNCTDNLIAATRAFAITISEVPCPLNLFMNIPWDARGQLAFEPPQSKPRQYVLFRAEMDLIAVMSACPQDLVPINGPHCKPTDAHYEVIE